MAVDGSGDWSREAVGVEVEEMLLAAEDRLRSTENEEDRLLLLLRELKAITAARQVSVRSIPYISGKQLLCGATLGLRGAASLYVVEGSGGSES